MTYWTSPAADRRGRNSRRLPTRVGPHRADLGSLSEWLNPILVKEARQALRSRQFRRTFFLMLVAGWAWSLLGLAAIGPAVYYSADGPPMFYVYYLILAFPLLVVAPYTTFHSLSTERQDRTYELVSITALSPRQILSGKIGGVALQMMVYLSAIFPCLAFTYLLRGLDIFTILFAVLYTSCFSLGLSMFGLLLASLPMPRQRQIGGAVVFVVVLIVSCFINSIYIFGVANNIGLMINSPTFWIVNLAWLTVYFNAFALTFLAARAQLMSAAQNHSTALRVGLVVAQISMTSWCAYALLSGSADAAFMFVFLSTCLWWFAGVFLTGEPPILSPRVKRDLPQSSGTDLSHLVRAGARHGLYLCRDQRHRGVDPVSSALSRNQRRLNGSALWQGATVVTPPGVVVPPPMRVMRPGLFEACVVSTSYLCIYLGLGKLILGFLRALLRPATQCAGPGARVPVFVRRRHSLVHPDDDSSLAFRRLHVVANHQPAVDDYRGLLQGHAGRRWASTDLRATGRRLCRSGHEFFQPGRRLEASTHCQTSAHRRGRCPVIGRHRLRPQQSLG